MGGWPNSENGGNLAPWPPGAPEICPSTGHSDNLGPISVPILGQNLALYPHFHHQDSKVSHKIPIFWPQKRGLFLQGREPRHPGPRPWICPCDAFIAYLVGQYLDRVSPQMSCFSADLDIDGRIPRGTWPMEWVWHDQYDPVCPPR